MTLLNFFLGIVLVYTTHLALILIQPERKDKISLPLFFCNKDMMLSHLKNDIGESLHKVCTRFAQGLGDHRDYVYTKSPPEAEDRTQDLLIGSHRLSHFS